MSNLVQAGFLRSLLMSDAARGYGPLVRRWAEKMASLFSWLKNSPGEKAWNSTYCYRVANGDTPFPAPPDDLPVLKRGQIAVQIVRETIAIAWEADPDRVLTALGIAALPRQQVLAPTPAGLMLMAARASATMAQLNEAIATALAASGPDGENINPVEREEINAALDNTARCLVRLRRLTNGGL